jgi:hypothetical protein
MTPLNATKRPYDKMHLDNRHIYVIITPFRRDLMGCKSPRAEGSAITVVKRQSHHQGWPHVSSQFVAIFRRAVEGEPVTPAAPAPSSARPSRSLRGSPPS